MLDGLVRLVVSGVNVCFVRYNATVIVGMCTLARHHHRRSVPFIGLLQIVENGVCYLAVLRPILR